MHCKVFCLQYEGYKIIGSGVACGQCTIKTLLSAQTTLSLYI